MLNFLVCIPNLKGIHNIDGVRDLLTQTDSFVY